jgi:hypothetical protein
VWREKSRSPEVGGGFKPRKMRETKCEQPAIYRILILALQNDNMKKMPTNAKRRKEILRRNG